MEDEQSGWQGRNLSWDGAIAEHFVCTVKEFKLFTKKYKNNPYFRLVGMA